MLKGADSNFIAWYPLRVTYSRELKVKEYLDSRDIENFVPMKYVEKVYGEQRKKILVPIIHNLIFVRTSLSVLNEIKSESPISSSIRYMMCPVKRKPLVVPDKQMSDFIAVAGSYDEQLLYLTNEEVSLKKGDLVRINSGIWEGVTGTFVRIKRGLRVVVSIEGIMSVATASLHPSMVTKIE